MATANDVLTIARAELGTKESPKNSNNVKYNTWYYGRAVSGNYPWCMAFVQWCLNQSGVAPVVRTASCGALMRAAKKAGQWVTGGYQPGDVVIYDFPGGVATDHTGIIERFDGKYVTAIEGNTGTGNDSNGGEVMRRKRKLDVVVGAWRPQYEEDDDDMTQERFNAMMDTYLAELAQKEPSAWSQEAREWAEDKGLIKGDAEGKKQYKGFVTREQLVVFLKRMESL